MDIQNKLLGFFKSAVVGRSINVLLLRVLGVTLFFLVTTLITQNFPASLVGEYDFSRSLLLVLGTLAIFGMQSSVIYYSGFLASKEKLAYIKQVYVQMVVIVLALSVLILLGSQLFRIEAITNVTGFGLTSPVTKTILTVFFYGITMLNIDTLRGMDKIYVSEVFRNVFRYLFFFGAVWYIFQSGQMDRLIDVFLLNFVVLALLSSAVVLWHFTKTRLSNTGQALSIGYKAILKRSAPMAVSAASFLLMQSLDVLMLTYFTDFETVAYYSVAVKLTLLISIVLSSVNAVIAPKIAEFYAAKSMERLKNTIRRGTQLIFIMTAPVILLLAVFATVILQFFGEGYEAARVALIILLAGQIINTLCGSIGVYLNMTGKQRKFQVILISALIINVVLNYILIPKYGMVGAAIATSASMMLWNLVAVIYVYKTDRVKTFLSW
ncbi:MAG: flippase [Flavobacteriaceae bacterium]|nr:flippase [Flavobacteriaceae bacterium]